MNQSIIKSLTLKSLGIQPKTDLLQTTHEHIQKIIIKTCDRVIINRNASRKKMIMIEFLEEIKSFLKFDYPITQQLIVLQNSIQGFSISRDTYRKHLKDLLDETMYYDYRKRQYFLRHIMQIKKAILLFKEPKDQFEYLNFKGEKKVDGQYYFYVNLKDYEQFYLKYKDVFDECVYKQSKFNTLRKGENTAQNNKDIAESNESSIEAVEPTLKEKKITVTYEETEIEPVQNTQKTALDSNEIVKQESIQEAVVFTKKVEPRKDVTVHNIPQRIQVVECNTPEKRMSDETPLKLEFSVKTCENGYLFDYSYENKEIIYFTHIDLFQASDYEMINNQLLVCTLHSMSNRNVGYELFRYYDGKLYYLEVFVPHSSIRMRPQVENMRLATMSVDMINFENEWFDEI